ncbi:hypothetical protein R1flu_011798 [Riccia fluitans]|uniref:Guanine nucleotide-binding protein alpha subunit n=1 Tax=Riccia fluitans TaxID=41844 RepID=A0ABD1Z8T9_9MARC
MGSFCGKEQQVSPRELAEKQQAEIIDQRIRRETKVEKDLPKKLLLLGAGESGKSTIFKQIKVLFQEGFADGERINYKTVIYVNVFQSMKILLDGLQLFASSDPEKYTLKSSNKTIGEELNEVGGRTELPLLTQDYAKKLEQLWKDPAVQAAFARGSELQLPTCTEYFLTNVHRLSQPDYVPSQEDVLFARVRTTGIVETTFRPHGSADVYKLFDVGGQRNERRKWIHLFEGVTAVIFCAALSEYDQTLSEDESTNRMVEARDLFDWVLKQPCFKDTSFLLFLNKFDLFEKKIHKVPLNVCEWFSDYKPEATGQREVMNAYKYVEKKFKEVFENNTNRDNVQRVFRVYRTTAVDKSLVKKTFNLVDDALTRRLLIEAKLL